MKHTIYADILRPNVKKEALVYDLILIFGASVFIALSAQFAFNVSFSPVPITGQTFAVILTGSLLGSRRGALAVVVYILEGIAGLPVFAQAHFGMVHLLGPTGGYLIGFIPAAFICGYLAERGWGRLLPSAIGMMLIGTIVIFAFGLIWISVIFKTENVLVIAFYPYLSGALLKIFLAALLYRSAWRFAKT
jgi:biotin transport system substrate-specific component